MSRLKRIQDSLTSVVDIICEFVVAVESGGPGETVHRTTADENCDPVGHQTKSTKGNRRNTLNSIWADRPM
ncbi:hypothetical protein C444_21331 [Haloarcula japonica DSM 6131]|uniref:Uncharacterized protein n=1 Tax=Haloarcula japonica (strain ATCC 49778 / DSM 6131 / JCM 7785 / NBRC 101032 / NCIMB 13157 / TR-1) TaxID=1227453 RepID=M0L1R1_HALJT|nr:hypothetical protein C444_21331 [Haloarcula japonica DSM 6131]